MKKPPQKVAYLSRNSVVSEIFPYCPTAQMAEFMLPNVAYRATVYRTGAIYIRLYCKKKYCKKITAIKTVKKYRWKDYAERNY